MTGLNNNCMELLKIWMYYQHYYKLVAFWLELALEHLQVCFTNSINAGSLWFR